LRRERRRQIDADEGALRRLPGRHLFGRDPFYEGKECRFTGIHDSEKLGIVIIHQELALVPMLSIAENMFLGNEQATARGDRLEQGRTRRARELLRKVGLREDPDTLVTNIGVGKQQLVEIAKALAKDVKLLILDEPTASAQREGQPGASRPAARIQGAGHDLDHDLAQAQRDPRVADQITVIRDGARRSRRWTRQTSPKTASSAAWSGATLTNRYPAPHAEDRRDDLRGQGLVGPSPDPPRAASHQKRQPHVRKGEVVGIAGLMGAGRTELRDEHVRQESYGATSAAKSSCTARQGDRCLDVNRAMPAARLRTEDRKTYGLNLIDHIKHNVTIANLPGASLGVIDDMSHELKVANEYRARPISARPASTRSTGNLSGGNQQKVVLSKWLFAEPGRPDSG
jgi:putative multiple sugar transport system ATP-binding protein